MPWTQEVFSGNPVVYSDPSTLFSTNNLLEPSILVPYVDFNFDFNKIGYITCRWKTALQFIGGMYLFEYDAVDGVRAFINDNLLVPDAPSVNSWKEQGQTKYSVRVNLNATGQYDLRVEYYSSKYSGRVRFYWNIIL